jgi:hypothetical protein
VDQKSGFMTATAVQASFLWSFQASAVVAAGPLEVSAPSCSRGSCAFTATSLTWATPGELSGLPNTKLSRHLYLVRAVIFIPSTETRNEVEGHTVTQGRMACARRPLMVSHVTEAVGYCTRQNFFLLSCLPSSPTVVKEDSALLQVSGRADTGSNLTQHDAAHMFPRDKVNGKSSNKIIQYVVLLNIAQ